MSTRRRNAISDLESVVGAAAAHLSALGFTRSDPWFFRRRDEGAVTERIEGIALRFEYGFRTCWLHVSVKFPRLIELLSEVRPFAYMGAHALRVPDFTSHLCCLHRLADLHLGRPLDLPEGIRQRDDGRLQRARPVPADRLQRVMLDLVCDLAVPALEQRLTLPAVAAAADRPGYEHSGVAGAWPLAARLLLQDRDGAAQAFRRHPHALGPDHRRCAAAQRWLISRGVDVGSVAWSAAAPDPGVYPRNEAWLPGHLL